MNKRFLVAVLLAAGAVVYLRRAGRKKVAGNEERDSLTDAQIAELERRLARSQQREYDGLPQDDLLLAAVRQLIEADSEENKPPDDGKEHES